MLLCLNVFPSIDVCCNGIVAVCGLEIVWSSRLYRRACPVILSCPFSFFSRWSRYVAYARSYRPKITIESKKVIVSCYKKLRQADVVGSSQTSYRITVRQLESMIRLSEALARLHLDEEVCWTDCAGFAVSVSRVNCRASSAL